MDGIKNIHVVVHDIQNNYKRTKVCLFFFWYKINIYDVEMLNSVKGELLLQYRHLYRGWVIFITAAYFSG